MPTIASRTRVSGARENTVKYASAAPNCGALSFSHSCVVSLKSLKAVRKSDLLGESLLIYAQPLSGNSRQERTEDGKPPIAHAFLYAQMAARLRIEYGVPVHQRN